MNSCWTLKRVEGSIGDFYIINKCKIKEVLPQNDKVLHNGNINSYSYIQRSNSHKHT